MKERKIYSIFIYLCFVLISSLSLDVQGASLPKELAKYDKKFVKYKFHKKVKSVSDGKFYDFKIQYGRVRYSGSNPEVIAFTRILMSPAGKNNYKKPSADRLSDLFPGSMVYTSLFGSKYIVKPSNPCAKGKWYKSSEYTTYVKKKVTLCSKFNIDSGHKARIGNVNLLNAKLE